MGLDQPKRGGVLDLSQRSIEPSTAQRVAAEVDAGLRCGGCRRRIETGLEFGRMEFQTIRGSFAASVHRTFACGRDDCDYHKKVGAEAHWIRPASYRWLPMSAMNPKDRPSLEDEPEDAPEQPPDATGGAETEIPASEDGEADG
jgi:hypothetical protein